MYSENIQQSNQHGWPHTDKDPMRSNINDNDQSPTTANTTLLISNGTVEIINETNQNSVSLLHVHFIWNSPYFFDNLQCMEKIHKIWTIESGFGFF